jgi:hypothetical protein
LGILTNKNSIFLRHLLGTNPLGDSKTPEHRFFEFGANFFFARKFASSQLLEFPLLSKKHGTLLVKALQDVFN